MPDLTLSLATLKGQAEGLKQAKDAMDACAAAVARLQVSTAQQVQAIVEQLNGLDSVGYYSSVDQLLRMERFAGKSAAVDFIQANPSCSEEDAVKVWDDAALASHPDVPVVAQPGAAMSMIYRLNLIKAGQIVGTDWEAHRGWIVVTDKSKIMGA